MCLEPIREQTAKGGGRNQQTNSHFIPAKKATVLLGNVNVLGNFEVHIRNEVIPVTNNALTKEYQYKSTNNGKFVCLNSTNK